VWYINDSKSTTPGGAIVALEAFDERSAVMIVGGYDKGSSMEELGEALAARAKAVLAIGATGRAILQAIEVARSGPLPACVDAGTLERAVDEARRHAAPGDTVVLSPACASYDQFDNYERRGEAFAMLVEGMTGE
jgi:UDP-N-acetylmuramoylalanine--D-glutamate ligase